MASKLAIIIDDIKSLLPLLIGIITTIAISLFMVYLANATKIPGAGVAVAIMVVYFFLPLGGLCLVINMLCLRKIKQGTAKFPTLAKIVNIFSILLFVLPVVLAYIASFIPLLD